jgi:hypothetical protein
LKPTILHITMTKEGSTNSCPSASNLQEQKALLKMENPAASSPITSGSSRWSTVMRKKNSKTQQIWPRRSDANSRHDAKDEHLAQLYS